MVRYELDRLGFYQFEWLIQVILKAKFGLRIEAWGGTADHGRDAYSEASLRDHQINVTYPGPVLFQAKFVSGANAAAAKPQAGLVGSCAAEAKRIVERKKKGTWRSPSSYFLYTNAPISTATRTAVENVLQPVLNFRPIVLGYLDVCSELDLHPEIARSFPQILTFQNLLSNLDKTVSDAINRDILARTETVLSKAKDVIPVFVPTAAFHRTWEVLAKHRFAVLTGPPEMGKTSISWMVALAHLAMGWQVIDCERPKDFFRLYQTSESQIFLADDAFGRTEYIGEIGKQWERELGSILHRIDNRHLLIWTSRKHILERAKAEMDLGSSIKFPMPGEVIVQADTLSSREKALILYRHAVAANLEDAAKVILKKHLHQIVNDPHFTPLRIYLFCRNSLPKIAKAGDDQSKTGRGISREIATAIREVTSEMTKTYKALPEESQWLLTILLDEANVRTIGDIEKRFNLLSPVPLKRPVLEMLDELDESFVRLRRGGI
jgi:hypothetical protein